MQPEQDPRVIAIRKNNRVGVGTCTNISEAYTDKELIDVLDDDNITDTEGAVKCAIELEGMHLEQALNARWGEDTDPELLRYNEWIKGGKDT
tara:strand:+ start:228 stop:503 length:276 start_codon:yes stop_codon:yes gene_type:complete